MQNDTATLLIFARYPVAGAAKTRLIPALGPDGAADAHRTLCEKTLATARASKMDICVAFSGARLAEFRSWLGDELVYVPQVEGDLGTKLMAAAVSAFQNGTQKLIIVGSDCPYITPEHYFEAEQALDTHDMVIGPALDGGYYLIGLRALYAELFTGIEWSTEKVLAQTCAAAEQLDLKIHQLEALSDIDLPEDWTAWQARQQ